MDGSRLLRIEVRTFYTGGYGYSCSYLRSPSGEVQSQGWVVGWDNDQYPPVFLHEFTILHGCTVALDYIRAPGNDEKNIPTLIMISAGRPLEQARLLRWFNEGWMGLESSAAEHIIDTLRQLATDELGLVDDRLRRDCWPLLLSIKQLDNLPVLGTVITHQFKQYC